MNGQSLGRRERWIDCLKGIGILFVVLGHSLPPFRKYINGFHMPLFFILSGYLWKVKIIPFKVIIKNYAKRYIVSYFILCGVNLLMFPALPQPLHKYIIGILYSRGTTEWMPNCSPLWFLTAMFMAMVLFEVAMEYRKPTLIIVMFGCGSWILSIFNIFKLPWNADTAMMAVVFMYIGHLLKRSGLICRICELYALIQICLSFLLLIVGTAAILFNPIESVNFDNNCYGNIILMLVGALSICFVLFYICYCIPWKGSIADYLSWLGRHTIFIMGFDYFSGTIARAVLEKVGFNNWASVFCLKVVLLTVGCFIWTWAVNRIRNESVRNALVF